MDAQAYKAYREKYLNAPKLNLDRPVDISLELSSLCNMACEYCLDPDTPVLMADLTWRPIKSLNNGDSIVAFDEHSGPNRINRKMRIASVEKVWTTKKPAYKIVTTHGEVTCSLDHKFLDAQSRWVETRNLEVGRTIAFLGMIQPAIERKIHDWDGIGVQHQKAKILRIESVGEQELIDITTSTRTFYGAGFPTHNCYHNDKKNLPFRQNIMIPATFKKIVDQAAALGVHSLKFNWRGESTMNPMFCNMTKYAKSLAQGSTFIDRLTNSNFKFDTNREDIFEGLSYQTKVKVSYDSFRKEVFEKQRYLGDHETTTRNIDKFYNLPGRKTQIVIQAVRTNLNKDEDLEGECKKRWPSATLSIRDMVDGRVNRNLDSLKHKERDASERQSCIQFHARLIFDWTGEAVGCCPDIRQELKLGSIHDKTVYQIFNSAKAKQIRKDLLSLEAFKCGPCNNCSSFETFKSFTPSFDS